MPAWINFDNAVAGQWYRLNLEHRALKTMSVFLLGILEIGKFRKLRDAAFSFSDIINSLVIHTIYSFFVNS